jgi:hypothetical protein
LFSVLLRVVSRMPALPLRRDQHRSISVARTLTGPGRSTYRRGCVVRVAGDLGQMLIAQPQAGGQTVGMSKDGSGFARLVAAAVPAPLVHRSPQ